MELLKLYLPDDEQKEFQIALVDQPAIESEWHAFNQEHQFKVVSSDRQIVSGYAMIAEKNIPRFDKRRGYYLVKFDAESIEQIVYNFFKNQITANTNEMHQTGNLAEGVFVFESFIIDSTRGIKAPEGFKQEADGSWFISMKVQNSEVWEKVKSGEYTGFSIENEFREVSEEEEQLRRLLDECEKLTK